MLHISPAFCLGLAALWLSGANSAPAQVASNAPDFLIRSWTVESGLPQSKVTAVVQTRDGYIWIGTYSGLARFDGVSFTVFTDKNTPGLRNSHVTALFESEDGTLWIGHENGDITTFKDKRFTGEKISAQWNNQKIHAISADEKGDVWLLNEAGLLARARDGLIRSPPPGPAPGLLNLTRDHDGKIWIARNGKLSVMENTELKTINQSTNAYVQGVCAAQGGGIWIASSTRIRKWKNADFVQEISSAPWGYSPLECFIETKDGRLIAGTSRYGFFILSPGSTAAPLHFNRIGDLQVDWIISLLEGREGNIWVGTGGNGLLSLRPNNIKTVSPPNGWRGRAVLSVCSDANGGLWIGTEGGGLYHYADEKWENFGSTNGIGNSYIWSIAEDHSTNLFVGTWGAGLFRRDGPQFKFVPGLENLLLHVPALFVARDGSLWAGTENGVLHYQNSKTNWICEGQGKPLRDARTFTEDREGSIWIGTAGYGLVCVSGNEIRRFSKADGLPSDFVECLHVDEAGALWIGTFGGGLCRFKDGKFSVIDSAQGLPNSIIGHIEDDDRGYFWMSSHAGILRAKKEELRDCADGKIGTVHFLAYGINDGLPTIECSEGLQPAGCKTADGRLWFPTSKGLVVVDPHDVRINQQPPLMALEKFLVDGQLLTNMTPPLKIRPGGSRFEFHYTALSFTAPEKVRFRYRVEGLEKNWQEAGTKREATYNFLPPGDYSFHVIACNNDGIWNEIGVSLPFTLLPHFWQTWWFELSGGLATVVVAGGGVWLEMRRRMRRRMEKLERERAVERERARIAKDIHDDLGASLTRITMLSQSALGGTNLPEPVTKNLDRIFGTARDLTRAMDEIVWAVNPRHDRLDSLANYLSRFAYEFLSVAEIRCRLEVPMPLPSLPVAAEVRHNLFLALKESLHNIVKHAAATEVRIELKLENQRIILLVSDNGRGFIAEGSNQGSPNRLASGYGLSNMKHRLEEIGGGCEFESKSGAGTTVKFSAPIGVWSRDSAGHS